MILTPAYGRDYKSKKEVVADFEANLDFVLNDIRSPWDGKYINKEQIPPGTRVQIRFSNLRKIALVERK